MSRYNNHDFQPEKRFRDDNYENPYRNQQTQNYGFRHDMHHDMIHQSHQPPQHHSFYPDYDRMNIYSTIKEIEEKHFSEVKRLKNDICKVDDIIYDLKCDREKDAKYIAELEQKLTKERILKEKYKHSEKSLMEKIGWLESSNSDMKSLLDKFSQQIPNSVCISPNNKDNQQLQKQESEQDKNSDSTQK